MATPGATRDRVQRKPMPAAEDTTGSPPVTPAGSAQLKAAGADLVNAGLSGLAAMASKKLDKSVDQVGDAATDEVEAVAADGGAGANAGLGGLRALLTGKSPVWAGLKGAWSGASTQAKLVAILVLILGLVLAPVLLVVLLLVLLVLAVIAAVRAATR